jgi:hypothetical protein
MPNPFAEAIKSAPTAVLVKRRTTPPAYSTSTTFSADGWDSGTAANCLFTGEIEQGETVDHIARATFNLSDIPSSVTPENLQIVALGVPFAVTAIKRRLWEGAHVAWTLLLNE